ncbi:MAG: hypothetical protein VXZ39_14905, partial [Planctomycetota bacterium]|nr:hypothetical protein [Planctomycetota bacterium]
MLHHDKLGFLAINWLQEWLLPFGPPVHSILRVAEVLLTRMAEVQDETEQGGARSDAFGVDRFVDARGRTPMFSVLSDMEAQEAPDMDKAVAYVEWLLSRGSGPDVPRRTDLPAEEEALVIEEKCAREVLTKWAKVNKSRKRKKGTTKAARRRNPYDKLQAPGRHLLSIIEAREARQSQGTLRSSSERAGEAAAELERDFGVQAAAAAAADDDEGKLPPLPDGSNREQGVGSGSGVVIFEVLDSDDESGELCRPIISHDAIMVDPRSDRGCNENDTSPRPAPSALECLRTPKRKRQRTANALALSSSFCSNGRGSDGEDSTRSRPSSRALMMSASSWAPDTNEKVVAAELLKRRGVRRDGKRARFKPPSFPRGSVFLDGTMQCRPVETEEPRSSAEATGTLPRTRWSIVQQNY